MIGNVNQKIEPVFFSYFATKTHGGAAQIGRIPAVRFDFIFEEPLHTRGVFGGATVFQRVANLGGNLRLAYP